MKKKVLTLMLCIAVLFNSLTVVHAASSEKMQVTPDFKEEDYLESRIDNTVFEWGNPTPFYDHVSIVYIGFDIFGNEANCIFSVEAYSDVNKISAYIYLQRYVLGKWTTITGGNFRKEVNSSNLTFSTTKRVDTLGSYRLNAQAFVYSNDGSVELVEEVSRTAVY